MRYSNDLRRKAMELILDKKKKMTEVSQLLNIGYNTLKLWKRKYKAEPDSLYQIIPSPGRPRVYDYEELAEFIKNNPDKYIREIKQENFEDKGQKASFGGIHKALKKLDLKLKKKSFFTKKETKPRENSSNKKSSNYNSKDISIS